MGHRDFSKNYFPGFKKIRKIIIFNSQNKNLKSPGKEIKNFLNIIAIKSLVLIYNFINLSTQWITQTLKLEKYQLARAIFMESFSRQIQVKKKKKKCPQRFAEVVSAPRENQ